MIKKIIQSGLGLLGYRLTRKERFTRIRRQVDTNRLARFFFCLKRAGFSPSYCIDVGANRGTWSRQAMEFFPAVKYILIEPQAHLKEYVKDLITAGRNIVWIKTGVGDVPGVAEFTIANRDDSSSFLNSNDEEMELKRIPMEINTLNQIVSENGGLYPEMVKIDTEGYDLKVLSGASDLFGRTEIFFVEAAVCCSSIENTLSKVVARMFEEGYKVVEITDLNQSPTHGVLWLVELAFMKRDSSLFESIESY